MHTGILKDCNRKLIINWCSLIDLPTVIVVNFLGTIYGFKQNHHYRFKNKYYHCKYKGKMNIQRVLLIVQNSNLIVSFFFLINLFIHFIILHYVISTISCVLNFYLKLHLYLYTCIQKQDVKKENRLIVNIKIVVYTCMYK